MPTMCVPPIELPPPFRPFAPSVVGPCPCAMISQHSAPLEPAPQLHHISHRERRRLLCPNQQPPPLLLMMSLPPTHPAKTDRRHKWGGTLNYDAAAAAVSGKLTGSHSSAQRVRIIALNVANVLWVSGIRGMPTHLPAHVDQLQHVGG